MSYAAIGCSRALRRHLTVVSRGRIDARLFDPPAVRTPVRRGRPRVSGARQPTLTQRLIHPTTCWQRINITNWYGGQDRQLAIYLRHGALVPPGQKRADPLGAGADEAGAFEPQAFLCTDLTADPLDILRWFVRRWSVEVTFAEVRRHLGVETQRQWSDTAIARTTPALLGLFSLVTVWADEVAQQWLEATTRRLVCQVSPDLQRCLGDCAR